MPCANVTIQDSPSLEWNAIHWRDTHKAVNNLRRRIYRATQAGDLKRVRNLQKLMLRSRSNTLVSIRKITQENTGKKSPGIDGVVVETNQAREALYRQMISTATQESSDPIKRVYIPKKSGKRPLGLPTIIDRCRQNVVKNALEPYWEVFFEGSSYGFRPGRSAHDAIEKLFCIASTGRTRKWVLSADIEGAFDAISHEFILTRLKGFPGRGLINSWLKAGVIENNQLHPTTSGVPQGSIIGPLLLNIALQGMGKALNVPLDANGYLRPKGPAVVRYADDCVILHQTRQGCEVAKETLENWLAERGLKLNTSKTTLHHLTEGFDFLGFNIRHYPVKNRKQPYITLIKPSPTSIKAFREDMRRAWKQVVGWSTRDAINYLNPKIRGWSNYYRIGAAKQTYASLDHWMWHRQKRFVQHRHPNKPWKWRYDKYWGTLSNRQDRWVFKDKQTEHALFKLAWTPIRRHTLVMGNASPDDATLKTYWQRRQTKKIRTQSSSSFRQALWKRQEGLCLLCGQPLDNGEKTHCHHRQPKSQGGSNQIDNLCLLHAMCHRQIHSQKGPEVASHLLEPCAG